MLRKDSMDRLVRELPSGGQADHSRLTQKWKTLKVVDVAATFVSTAMKTTNMNSQRVTLQKTCRRNCH